MKHLRLVGLALLAIVLSACSSPPQSAGGDGARRTAITGPSWRLERFEAADAPPLDPSAPPTIRFGDDGRVTGFAGVNRCSGSAVFGTVGALGEVPLRFGPMATTRMAGPPERMAVEASFLAMLGKVRAARAASGADGARTLVLLDDDGPLATFVAVPDPVEAAPAP